MSGFLRFVGIVNAAVWFGAGVFFAFLILPGVFSPETRRVFGDAAFPYYSGAVALVLFRRFFVLQIICGFIAVLHLFAEKLYLGRALPRLGTTLVSVIFGLGLVGGIWLHPRMADLHHLKYYGADAEIKEKASRSFAEWHIISEIANVLILAGLLVHLVRVSKPEEPGRYGTLFPKFRG